MRVHTWPGMRRPGCCSRCSRCCCCCCCCSRCGCCPAPTPRPLTQEWVDADPRKTFRYNQLTRRVGATDCSPDCFPEISRACVPVSDVAARCAAQSQSGWLCGHWEGSPSPIPLLGRGAPGAPMPNQPPALSSGCAAEPCERHPSCCFPAGRPAGAQAPAHSCSAPDPSTASIGPLPYPPAPALLLQACTLASVPSVSAGDRSCYAMV